MYMIEIIVTCMFLFTFLLYIRERCRPSKIRMVAIEGTLSLVSVGRILHGDWRDHTFTLDSATVSGYKGLSRSIRAPPAFCVPLHVNISNIWWHCLESRAARHHGGHRQGAGMADKLYESHESRRKQQSACHRRLSDGKEKETMMQLKYVLLQCTTMLDGCPHLPLSMKMFNILPQNWEEVIQSYSRETNCNTNYKGE